MLLLFSLCGEKCCDIIHSLSVFLSFRLADKEQEGEGWKFYFKLFCFSEPESVPADSVEFAFMFEQV